VRGFDGEASSGITSGVVLAVLGGGPFGTGPFAPGGSAALAIAGGDPVVICGGANDADGPVPPI